LPVLVAGLSALLIATRALGAPPAGTAVPSLEDLCSENAIVNPTLSPDGTRIAFLTMSEGVYSGVYSLALFHLDTGKAELLVREGRGDITTVFWKGNDRLVYGGYGGNTLACLFLDGKHKPEEITGNRSNGFMGILSTLPNDPRHVILGGGKVYRADVESGLLDLISPADPLGTIVGGYIADKEGALRLRESYFKDHIELQSRQNNADKFRTILSWTTPDPGISFVGFAADDDFAYCITTADGEFGVLHPFDMRTGKLGPAIAAFPGRQMSAVAFSRDRSRVLGVWAEGDTSSYIWLDEGMRRLQARIDASLPGRRNVVIDSSTDQLVHLVHSSTPQDLGTYYVLDMRRHALLPFGRSNPRLDPSKMAPVSAVEFPASDGMRVHGILTTPAMGSPGPHPLVVILQSDFFSNRFDLNFDRFAQILASRGYASLKLDFRGTWGYGKAYQDAGKHEVCGKIPSDIHDAARWAIAAGHAQEGRICIWGSGYLGGDLALMEAAYDPDLFCCAVNEGGEPDISRAASLAWKYLPWYQRRIEEWIGLDAAVLAKHSPILALDRLKGPVFNIYDLERDGTEWERLRSGLKKANKECLLNTPFRYRAGQRGVDAEIGLYRQTLAFLDKNLGSPPSAPVAH
jgi:dipeptidyl aminopeptidase/acylaminoacyl peptidase